MSVRIAGVDRPLEFLVLGGNQFGSGLDERASFALLDDYVAGGGTMIDTALVYADYLPHVERSCSERTIGRWLKSRGMADEVLVATKGGHPSVTPPKASRLAPQDLRADVERSCENLGLDRLPLWWLHRDDPRLLVDEIVEPVAAMASAGLIGAWGVCNWSAERLASARDLARDRGLAGPVADSAGFSLAAPTPEALAADLTTLDSGLAALHTRTQLPLVAYSTQAKGWFDKFQRGDRTALDATFDQPVNREIAAALASLGDVLGASPTEIALAAVSLLPFPVLAVAGPRTAGQLASCRRAEQLDLTGHREILQPLVQRAVAAMPKR